MQVTPGLSFASVGMNLDAVAPRQPPARRCEPRSPRSAPRASPVLHGAVRHSRAAFLRASLASGAQAPPTRAVGSIEPQVEARRYPVGVEPDARFRPALFSFGDHESANGIIEYRSDAFCGALQGELLVTYFSSFDQIRRLELDAGGERVLSDATLRRSDVASGGSAQLVDPLSIAQDAAGRLYVSEFGAARVTVFEPVAADCGVE